MTELLAQIKAFVESAIARAGEYSGVVAGAQQYIVEHFGQKGLIAAYITLGALALFVVWTLVKLTIKAAMYLAIAIALAYLASTLTPLSFSDALPVTVTVCALVLLFKG
ncbi:MAG: hypothetical protein NTW07_03565 [candidate division Zixibacteria bacterium]|nr:hypothetical protein [candidate division Zixibacteria bacterium]